MSNFVQGAIVTLLFLILGAIFAMAINGNSYDNQRAVKIIEKLDEISAKLDALNPRNPQFNVVHGYYKGAKEGEQPFRVVQVDESGYIILSAEAPN